MISHRAWKKLSAGLPLLVFLTGGSLFLAKFVQGRVEAKDSKLQSRSEREFSIEEEHKRMMAKLDPENAYKVVRIHRPEDD
ncbi:Cytochrome c oxidase assembly protein COX16 [Nannochloropsis gaditana]|nr:Cytochrome c oxidase assembly protein COX16 [Nannochloropsis gaditana]